MDVKKAIELAKVSLELDKPFVSITREALTVLVEASKFHPSYRYTVDDVAIIHTLVDGRKVVLQR